MVETRSTCSSSSMAKDGDKLHIAMFPWLAFGHIVPYLEVAKLIAQKGHKISFISTPRNIDRLPKIPPHLTPFIDFVKLPLPLLDDLPLNAEATIDLPEDKVPFLKKAYDGLQEHLSSFLNASKPDWICYDFAPHWLPPIAAELGISRAFLSIFWATSFCVLGSSAEFLINGDDKRTLPEHFTVSPEWIPFPSNIVFRLHEAKRLFKYVKTNPSEIADLFRFGSTIAGCQVMAIRSCAELQPQWLGLLQELYRKPIVPLGLIPPSIQVTGETNTDETWLKITSWLGKQEKGSVVYVAFGSEALLSQEELTELALGLELSGLPFFWALRKGPATVELPNGFEERTRGRGVVWTSWVPQLRILGHESVGGFLTHCGWSSVIEGLNFGLAFVMLPIMVDQGLIARMCEEKQVGVEIPRDENDGSFTRDGVAESLKLVMLDERGKIYKEKAKENMRMIGDKDLHQRYIDNFVEYLQTHRNACP